MSISEKPRAASGSLIERAAAVYGFDTLLGTVPAPSALQAAPDAQHAPPETPAPAGVAAVDREHLARQGLIVPGAAPTALSEEFRIAKRHVLLTALGGVSTPPAERGRLVLVTSGNADDGKSFCSVNLALSMASETDIDIVLVDADVAKPEVPGLLGIEAGLGLLDALADPARAIEPLLIRTDIPNLSVLPAGVSRPDDAELLASARTPALLDRLLSANPRRVVLVDSPPALAAAAASVLALHAGQTVFVVRADRTGESELREALALLEGCPEIRLLLNRVSYRGTNRRFGSYYGGQR